MVKIKKFIDKAYSFIEPLFKEPKKHLKTWLVILGVLVASWAVVFFLRSPEPTQASWWNETWLYRRAIQISNDNEEDLTDFQVAITLDTAALISAGKLQDDCDDLRITDQNGKLLDFFISNCNSPTSHLWAKVPFLPSSSATIFIYYGNPSAQSVSNAQKTFDFTNEIVTGGSDAYFSNVANVSVSIATAENGVTPIANNYMIKFTGIITGTSNPYAYYKLYQGGATDYLDNYTIQNGDYLTFLVYNYDTPGVGMEINFTDGSFLRWNHKDQDDIDAMLENPAANGFWYWRYINLSDRVGKSINYISVVQEDPTPEIDDTWTGYLNNIAIKQYNDGVSASSPSSEEISPGPVAYWKFDEGTGITAHDSSGQGNDGILGTGSSAPTWQSEDFCVTGKCLYFDGSNNISFSNPINQSNLEQEWTVTAWVKIASSTGDGTQRLISNMNLGLELNHTSSNKTLLYLNSGDNDYYMYGTQDLKDDKWHHVAFVFRNSDGLRKIYIDAHDDSSSGPNKTSTPLGISNTLYVGSGTVGFIDEVKIYPYARTADEIKSDYAAGLAGVGSTKGSSAIIGSSGLQSALSDGLVGYWELDETSWDGTVDELTDSSGNSNHAQGIGATAPDNVSGKFGTAGGFSGSNYFDADLAPNINNSSFTISGWIYEDDLTEDRCWFGLGVSGQNQAIHLRTYTNGEIRFGFYSNDLDTESGLFTAGQWHHVVYSYDNSTGERKIYFNGVEKASDISSSAYIGDNTLTIGRWSSDYWLGSIDEVRIYNRTLSPTEVKKLYNWAPGPIAHWNFDEGSGETLYDNSGNGNNGDLNNMTNSYWVKGKYGQGLEVDTAYANMGTNSNLELLKTENDSATFQAWVKTNDQETYNLWIIDKKGWYSNGSGYTFLIHGNKPRFTLRDGEDNQFDVYSNSAVNDNTWHHIAITVDRPSTTYKFYVDGKLDKSSTFEQISELDYSTQNFYVANDASTTTQGSLDEVRVYNYARTQKQILEDMQGSMPGAARMPQPIAHWRFDEGYGTTVNNSGFGGSALNGTLGTGDSAPSWSNNGKIGKALGFEGSQYIALGNSSAYQIDNKTISFWAKPDVNIDNYQLPFYGGANWYVGFKPTNQMMVSYKISNGSQQTAYTTEANTVIPDEWHYYAYSFDVSGDNVVISFYKDGQHISSSIHTAGYSSSYASSFYLGGVETVFYYGLLDEVKVYNYALTEAEVKEDYNQGKSLVMGSSGTDSSGSPSSSATSEYCIPGDDSYCTAPVSEWNFEENQGTTARDTSGNNNNGTLTNMDNSSWTTGPNSSGAALNFDGVNEYIDTSQNLTPTNFTASMWIYPTSWTHQAHTALLTERDGASDGLMFFILSQGNLNLDWGNGSTSYRWNTGYQPPLNTWTYLTIKRDSNGRYLYVNGKYQNSTATAGGPITTTNNLTIGSANEGYYFQGKIDNVKIYDYARTPAQIAWDYNQGGPIGWWKFDECQGDIVYDSSGNGNNGSINIGASSTQTTTGTCTDGSSASAWYNGASGKWNSSLSFDGEDDYVRIVDNNDIDITDSISTSSWVKFSTLGNSYILAKRDDAEQQYAVYYQNSTNLLAFYTWGANGAVSGSFSPQTDRWYHIVSTYNSSTGTGDIYVDGKAITTDNTADPITAANSDLFIAGRGDGSGGITYELNGQVDDVRIYNYALTEEQVKTLYNQGAVHFGN